MSNLTSQIAKVPWFIVLSLILLLNMGLNYASVSTMKLVPFVGVQVLLFMMIGAIQYVKMKDTTPVVLMAGVFVIASFLTWRNFNTAILEPSMWVLLIAQVALIIVAVGKVGLLNFHYGVDTAFGFFPD